MLARAARPVAIVLALVAIWIGFLTWLTFSYADAMLEFEEQPGYGGADWLPMYAVLAACAAMVAGAVVLFLFARRDPAPWWMKALTSAGLAAILVCIGGYLVVSYGGVVADLLG